MPSQSLWNQVSFYNYVAPLAEAFDVTHFCGDILNNEGIQVSGNRGYFLDSDFSEISH